MARMSIAPIIDPKFDDPSRWTVRKAANVFDAHEEHDAQGKVVQQFDKKRLLAIADKCNARDKKGQHCPLTLGHTFDDAKSEEDQPIAVGYARGFHVTYDEKLGRDVLRADFYIACKHFDKAATFPRVSIERFSDDTIDPIALLRKTPARDLGQWVYGKGVAGSMTEVYGDGADAAGAVWRYAKRGKGQVVRYSMEDRDDDDKDDKGDGPPQRDGPTDADGDVPAPAPEEDTKPDPTDPAGAEHGDEGGNKGDDEAGEDAEAGEGELPPEQQEMARQHFEHALANHPVGRYVKACYDKDPEKEKYEAGPGVAGATNSFVPGSDDDKKKRDRMARTNATPAPVVAPAKNGKADKSLADRLADQNAKKPLTVEDRVLALERDRDRAVSRYRKSEASRLVDGFRQNYAVADEDAAEMVEELTPLDDEARERVLKRYARLCAGSADPTKGELIPTRAAKGTPDEKLSRQDAEKAKKLATKKGIGFDEALKEIQGGE